MVHPNTADYRVKHLFQLVFTDTMGPITLEALGGSRFATKTSDEHTKWTETYLLKLKEEVVSTFQAFMQSMVIPSGLRIERLRTDESGQYVGMGFKDYGLQTVLSPEYASTQSKSACPSASEKLLRPWFCECFPTVYCQTFSGEN